MKRDAVFSVCGLFRYWLLREWDATRPTMVLLMLNPSTADASKDDPTIRKGIGFAERLGFGRLVVVNLFAYRATDPNDLRRYGYQVGPKNDDFIAEAVLFMNRGHLGRLVCAWGANARGLARPGEVLSDLRRMGVQPMALRLAADGVPWHPLMLSYNDATGAPRQLVEMP